MSADALKHSAGAWLPERFVDAFNEEGSALAELGPGATLEDFETTLTSFPAVRAPLGGGELPQCSELQENFKGVS